MALGWIGATIALGSVVRKAKQLVLAIGREADNRRHLVRKDRRQRRQIASAAVLHCEEIADG